MVEEFREEPEHSAPEVLSPGFNERTAEASAETAGAEQSSAMTPTAEPSKPGGAGGAPDLLVWTTAFSLFVLSIFLPAVSGGGWLWLPTAVMLPLIAAWVLIQRWMINRRDQLHMQGRRPTSSARPAQSPRSAQLSRSPFSIETGAIYAKRTDDGAEGGTPTIKARSAPMV